MFVHNLSRRVGMLTQEMMRGKFSAFYREFVRMHTKFIQGGNGHRGHGPDHDMLVAGYTLMIAGDDHRLAEMAWVAAHLHSFDRFLGNDAEKMIDEILTLVEMRDVGIGQPGWYEFIEGFKEVEILEIKLAVMRHDKPNADDDNSVQIILQDADRLANVMPLVIARSGQFQPDLPVVELGYTGLDKHPETTYKSPRSIHDDLLGCLEWHPDSGTRFAIRTEAARELGEELFTFLRRFFELTDKHFKMAGL